jgi:Tfp pilus assembly protein FimT
MRKERRLPDLSSSGARETVGSTPAFTLLELILVMTLMALATGFVTLFFAGSLTRSRVATCAQEISGSMRYGRVLAAERQADEIFLVDLDSRSFGIEGRPSRALPPGMVVRVLDPLQGELAQGKYRIRLLPSGGVQGGSILVSRGSSRIVISPDPVVGVKMVKE